MEDSFWFWSNVSMEQGGGRGYCEGQEQEEMMKWKSMIKIDDDHHHQNTTVATIKKTKGKKGGRNLQRKPEKKNPKRGVGIAKLEETIKQKNSQLPPPDRQVYHGYPTASVDSVLPTTYDNQSQSQIIQFHHLHPFLHHQQQKQTATVSSSSSIDVHGANTHIIDGGKMKLNHDINNDGSYDQVIMEYGSSATNVKGGLHQQPYVLHPSKQQEKHGNSTYNVNGGQNMNHGVDININDKGGYDQVIMNYGSETTNVNGGLYQLMNHDHQQPYLLHPPSKQQQQQHGNRTDYNPSAGSGDKHGNNNGAAAGFYSPKVVELSSTQNQEHYHDHLSQHSGLNNQKNLNNGENIRGFTRYSKTNNNKSTDFLELNLGRNWNYNNVDIKKDSKPAGLLRAGYSGLSNDQVELMAVHRKGKSSSSSSSSNILMEYEFLSLTNGGIKGHHQFHSKKEYEPHYYSSNYSSSSCIMEESAASSSAVRNGSTDLISSSSQSNSDHHGFLDLSLKLSSYH